VTFPPSLLKQLAAVVGPAHATSDPERTLGARTDWTGRWVAPPSGVALVRASTHEEVAAVVACCAAAGVAVVPQGGNTGLVAGATPLDGGVVLDTTRLDYLGEVQPGGVIHAESGVRLATLQRRLMGTGWRFAVDLGARDAATLGGMVATNAGGHHALRWGSMRRWLRGVRAVTAEGSELDDRRALSKDNTGPDLLSLLTGSEGTLAVMTAVVLELSAEPEDRCVAWVPFDRLEDAVTAGQAWRACPEVEALEFLPWRDGWAVLVEATGVAGVATRLADLLGVAAERAEVATDQRTAAALWERRTAVPLALRASGVPVKADVSVPVGSVAEFVAAVLAIEPTAVCFGHLGDGNVHVNLPQAGDGDHAMADAREQRVLALAAEFGGTVSAEHGIGRAKVNELAWRRTPVELAWMDGIKDALDPGHVLNPGVIRPSRRVPEAPL
jgi:FAD/FMN-containing dehydrogenase